MSPGTEEQALVTRKHRDGSEGERGASLSPLHREALASIKRELGAIVIFGALFAWAVLHWTEGLEEGVLLGGYGVGASLWVWVRVQGLLRSVRDRSRENGDGPQQEQ